MSVFTESELRYLDSGGNRRLARIATVGGDGTPHVGIEVRGRAEAIDGAQPMIRIHPERIVPWGLSADDRARSVGR